jgi:hypothetical protein
MSEITEPTGGYEIIEEREDGTFVILLDGLPFHVCQEYRPDLLQAVLAQLGRPLPSDA